MKRLLWTFSSVLILTLITGCTATTTGGAVGVDRKQIMLVSSEQAFSNGDTFYAQEVKKANQAGAINPSKKQTDRLRAIARKLIPRTKIFRDDAPSWPWEVNIMESKEINAYCAGRGKIMFYTGILEKVTISDDEIAAVMGHEIAHALREHSRERMSQAYMQNIGVSLAGALSKNDNVTLGAAILGQYAFALPYSREHEREADRMGLELMARAGYNPNAAMSVWEKMSKIGGSKTPEFLSTHPSNESRIDDMRHYLPIATKLYQEAKGK